MTQYSKLGHNVVKKLSVLPYFLAEHNLYPIKKNRICFVSSPDYADNARALFDYMINHGYAQKYELIWLVQCPENFPDGISGCRVYRTNSVLGALKQLSSAYVFATHGLRRVFSNRRGTLQILLWHGCGYKAADTVPTKKLFDYMLVPGELFIDSKTRFFNCDRKQILPLGYPRYDLMFQVNENKKAAFDDMFRVYQKEKVVLWMPTFRKSPDGFSYPENHILRDYPVPILKSEADLTRINNMCAGNGIILAVKAHRHEGQYFTKDTYSNIRFLSDADFQSAGVQLYEMLPYTNALITDYSSIAVDYLLLNRPIGFTLDDFNLYKKTRGFIFDNPLQYMPGAHIYCLKDLETFILSIAKGEDYYQDARRHCSEIMHHQEMSYCKSLLDYFGI